MTTPSKDNLLLGRGKVFFDRFVNGLPTGKRHLGNATALNMNTTVEEKKKYSSMQAETVVYNSVVTQVDAVAKITLDEYDPENLALVLLGENALVTQAALTGKVVSLAHVKKGHFYELGDFDVTNVAFSGGTPQAAITGAATAIGTVTSDGTVTSSGTYTGTVSKDIYVIVTTAPTTPGTITGCKFQYKEGLAGTYSADVTASASPSTLVDGVKVLLAVTGAQTFIVGDTWKITCTPTTNGEYIAGTDAVVYDAAAGLIEIKETGAIADDSTITVTYDTVAGTRIATSGAADVNIEGELYFVGDPTVGPAKILNIWRGKVVPDGDLGLITDDWGSFGLTVTAMDDTANHPDYRLYRLIDKNKKA